MPVHAVETGIQLPANKPFHKWRVGPIESLMPRLVPGELFGPILPEADGILIRAFVNRGITNVGGCGKIGRGSKSAPLLEQSVDCFVHWQSSQGNR